MKLKLTRILSNNYRKYILITVLVIVNIVALISIKNFFNLKDNSIKSRSLSFVQVINYSIPLIKVSSFNIEDTAEQNKSIKEKLWAIMGIDISSPTAFLEKEIALIKCDDDSYNTSSNALITPYVLKEVNIYKKAVDEGEGEPNKKALNIDKPEVLIYHSHTTESYSPHGNNNSDEAVNVCAIGDVLQYELEKNYGVSVIHDKTNHNELGGISAYSKSRVTVNKYLKQYGNFKIIIDLHRDASSNKKNDITTFNKETLAKCMFVLCKQGPYANKNWEIANKLMDISNSKYPNLFKKDIYTYNKGTLYFNQDLSPNSILIEVGSNLNNIDEAKASSKYIAKIIAEYINGK